MKSLILIHMVSELVLDLGTKSKGKTNGNYVFADNTPYAVVLRIC
jgi:hypothetical protein